MPFQNALRTDKYYRLVALEHADAFWALHKQTGIEADSVSSEVKQLIFSLLAKDPQIRPSLNEILEH